MQWVGGGLGLPGRQGGEEGGVRFPSFLLFEIPATGPLSSAVAYGFSFLCDCCSELM